jgi:hypothetical protein
MGLPCFAPTHRRLDRSLSWCESSHRCRLRRSALQTLRASVAPGGLIKISADDRCLLNVISRRRSNSVAFGVKRTFSGTRIQNRICEYATYSRACALASAQRCCNYLRHACRNCGEKRRRAAASGDLAFDLIAQRIRADRRATGTTGGLQIGFGYFYQVAGCLTVSPAFPI